MRPCFPRPGIQPNNSIKALVTTAKQINNINLLNLQHLCTLLNAYWLLSQPMSLLNELAHMQQCGWLISPTGFTAVHSNADQSHKTQI